MVANWVSHQDTAFFRFERQFVAEVGVRDGDELAGTGAEALAAQMRNAVLGNDVVHIVLAGCDDSAGCQNGLDLADRAALGRGRERDEALAALGLACAAHIVDLAAGAGHVLRTDRFRAHLSEQIDLQRRIDGDHIVVLADDVRVVDVVHRQDLKAGVVVDIIIDALRTEGEGRHGLAAVDLLFAVVHRSAFEQFDHAVGEHFRVDAEVVLRLERHSGRIRDRADAKLDARAIRNLLSDEVADRAADIVDHDRRQHGNVVRILNDRIDLRNVNLGAAQASRLLLIHFNEDAFGLGDHRLGVRAGGRKAEITVAVHRRDGYTICVEIVQALDMAGDVTVIGRKQVGIAAVDRLARAAAGEPGVARHLAKQGVVFIKSKRIGIQHRVDLDVLRIGRADLFRHRADDCRGLRRAGVHADDPAGLHLLRDLLRSRELCLIDRFVICHFYNLLDSSFFA